MSLEQEIHGMLSKFRIRSVGHNDSSLVVNMPRELRIRCGHAKRVKNNNAGHTE